MTHQQSLMLTYQTITFALGSHFNCPPHSWDDQPFDRVMFDYLFLSVAGEIKQEAIDKAMKQAKRNQGGGAKSGRPLRTTSDADFFDRMNANMRE
tara:strand:- start:426 stop:710 length:285 start_codon:yes stop_codon:yes gene_type:complete